MREKLNIQDRMANPDPTNIIDLANVAITAIGVLVTLAVAVVGWYVMMKSDFSMFVNPPNGIVLLGGVIPTTLSVEGQKYKRQIHLSVKALPPGVTVTFSPEDLNPSPMNWSFHKTRCSSIVTIVASTATPGSEYTIIINGAGPGVQEHNCTYRLICLNARN